MSAADYARHPEQAPVRRWVGSVRDRLVDRQRRSRLIVAVGGAERVHVSSAGHVARVERLNLLSVVQDVCELSREERRFLAGELEMRERRYAFHVGQGQRSGHSFDAITRGDHFGTIVVAAKRAPNRMSLTVTRVPDDAGCSSQYGKRDHTRNAPTFAASRARATSGSSRRFGIMSVNCTVAGGHENRPVS